MICKMCNEKADILHRLIKETNFTDTCWIWEGGTWESGYGRIRYEGKSWAVHVLAYYLFVEKFNLQLDTMHHCDNPPCWNFDHTEPATRQKNMLDARSKGRWDPIEMNRIKYDMCIL